MDASQSVLWARIKAFDLDEPGAALSFSQRLARENGWTISFARSVVEEYKRFAFLAMAAGHPATPSEEVDQAWHLHLCYTESYWKHFCREVLGGPLHHGPTKGGAAEHTKHCDWYERTLASYRRLFGAEPPADIWPATAARFRDAAKFVRVNASEHWIIPKPRWLPVMQRLAGALAVAFLATGCGVAVTAAIPVFDLHGPEFLLFFVLLTATVFILAAMLRRRLREPAGFVDGDELPRHPYAVAALAGGSVQAVHAAVVGLVRRGLLELTASGRLKRSPDAPQPTDLHPIESEILRNVPACGETLRVTRPRVQAPVNVVLDDLREQGFVLKETQGRRVRWQPLLLALAVPAIGMVKITVGITRDRPVGFLFALTIVSAILAFAIFSRRALRSRKGDRALAALRQKFSDLRRGDYFRSPADATPEMLTLGVGLFGSGLLANTAYADLERPLKPPPKNSGCSSGCGGGVSGCGGGSGCGSGGGGGGDSGGGGCGGCGGGGD